MLFAKHLPDPRGCALAVCLRKEKAPPEEKEEEEEEWDDGSRALCDLILRFVSGIDRLIDGGGWVGDGWGEGGLTITHHAIVDRLAARHGREARPLEEATQAYGEHFVRFFHVTGSGGGSEARYG